MGGVNGWVGGWVDGWVGEENGEGEKERFACASEFTEISFLGFEVHYTFHFGR